MKGNRSSLFGFPVDIGLTPDEVIDRLASEPLLMSYLNPFAWAVSRKRNGYLAELEAMDLVVCDGVAIQRAVRKFAGVHTAIITPDYSGFARQYLRLFTERGSRVCLVGGQADVLEAARLKLHEDFRGINIVAAFPGYGNGLSDAREYLLESGTEFVLAGLGMGLQEKFLLDIRAGGWQGSGICVGAFFDRLARPEHDYPQWSVRLNLRFLGNITRRPGYYLKRYCVDYLPFLKQYVLHSLGRKKTGD